MRKIEFEGPVNRVSAVKAINQLEKLDKEGDSDIYLVVNGPGGCCFSMLGVVDAMRRARSRVGVIVIGQAMSADFLIMAAAEKGMRLSFSNSSLMIHEPRGTINLFSASDLSVMESIRDTMITMMKDTLHMSESELDELVKRDVFLTPQEALDMGFIDNIVDGI